MAEAAAVCLDDCGHHTPVPLTVDGDESRIYDLEWAPIGDQARRAWADEQRTTEEGAYGIAILVVSTIRGHAALGRSMRGTGFDYWLGESTSVPFARKARLEVSGIRRGSNSTVSARIKQKSRQVSASSWGLPGIVVVVEFGTPLAMVVDQ